MRLDRNPARTKAEARNKPLEEFPGIVPKLRAEVERLNREVEREQRRAGEAEIMLQKIRIIING